MPTRAERRAAEHAARKLAYKQLRSQNAQTAAPAAVEPETHATAETDLLAKAQAFFHATSDNTKSDSPAISEIQLEANRANAQKSSGPRSDAGKAKSSRNAVKHGLTGKFTLLPGEDAEEYEHILGACFDAYQPVTGEEQRLVHSMNECTWRVTRLQYLEAAIMLKGQIEFAEKFEDRTPAERRLLIQAETYLKYEKSIRNLHIQETRLLRTREKAQAELTRLKTMRRREEMLASMQSEQDRNPPSPTRSQSENGFENSTGQNRTAAAPQAQRSAA